MWERTEVEMWINDIKFDSKEVKLGRKLGKY